jgi:flagellar biosynthesis GTPase FlhF
MPTYLLKWDATRWDWRNLRDQAEQVLAGTPVIRVWPCGTSRKIFPGDRVFVLRTGREPRGIVASGTVTRGSFDSPKNEYQDGVRDRGTLCVEFKFDVIVEPRQDCGITRAALGQGALAAFNWDVAASGTAIPDAVVAALEAQWRGRGSGGAGSAAQAGIDNAESDRKRADVVSSAEADVATKAAAEAAAAAEVARLAAEKAEAARLAAEKAAAEKDAAAQRAAAQKAAAEKAAAEKAAAERAAKEKAAAERAAAEKAAEKAAAEKAAAQKAAAPKAPSAAKPAAPAKSAEPPKAVPAKVDHDTGELTAPTPAMYPAIVADYFEMLRAELRGEMFSKADHRHRLAAELGLKDPDLVDLAFQQVSSVLLEIGMPVVDGFRPLNGWPVALANAVQGHLEAKPELVDALWIDGDASKVAVPVELDDSRMVLMPTPLPGEHDSAAGRAERWAPSVALDLDFRAREARDEALAVAGQRFVLAYERARLRETGFKNLVGRIEWVAQDRGDALGFHVRSFDEQGEPRSIVVKTTNFGARLPFALTHAELQLGNELGAKCCIYRVFAFSRNPRLFVLPGPFERGLSLVPLEHRAFL